MEVVFYLKGVGVGGIDPPFLPPLPSLRPLARLLHRSRVRGKKQMNAVICRVRYSTHSVKDVKHHEKIKLGAPVLEKRQMGGGGHTQDTRKYIIRSLGVPGRR